ncbi:hypothetical protein MZD04_gp089 [Pseudomonas phage Psa21]|uniref:Uncharacterized protein n=1 Tax=Pseudomonas phage Psa21 TaxID=2530023 RepID=A0A481W5S2_9CAUD|nr:hypothetical protein MZD04_gp089 [Pseudomonas phage Psa21]QBJ02617.1 hypothetical protein PSA21_89 [Pseudomonas phage Psa21]
MFELLLTPNETPINITPQLMIDPSNQATGATALVDLSGRNVTISNPNSLAVADVGPKAGVKSIYFPGTGITYLRMPYAQMPNLLDKDYTIEFWYRPETLKTGSVATVSQWRQTVNQGGIILQPLNTGVWNWSFGPASENAALASAQGKGVGVWSHIAITRQGNTHRIWIDGVMVASVNNVATRAQLLVDWTIGAYMGSGGNPPQASAGILNGWMAKIHVYQGCKYRGNFTPE